MADGIELNLGTGGSTVATDDVGGVHYQYVKLAYGANNSVSIVDATNALPTDLRKINGDPIDIGSGSAGDGTQRVVLATDNPGLVVEDAASVGGERAFLVAGVRNDAASSKTSTDGDFGNLALDAAGRVGICDLGGSITVDGTVSISGTVTVAGTVTANLAAGTNNIGDVDVLTLPATAAEGAALPANFLVVAGDDGTDTHPLQLSATGHLKVVHDSTIAAPVDLFSILENPIDAGIGASSVGTLRVVLASDQPAVTVAQATAANLNCTEASAAAILTAVQLIDDIVATDGAAAPTKGAMLAGTDGTNAQTVKVDAAGELQVDVLTLPSVTIGAAIPAGSNNIGDVDVLTLPSLPAGTNNIGDVDVLTLPALPAGSNLIGNVGLDPRTSGGVSISKTISAASTNSTNVKGSAGQVYGFTVTNTNASPRYFKLYNKATAPTIGSDTPVATYLVPGNTAGAGIRIDFTHGLAFGTGIGFGLTTGVDDADTGAVAANELVVNIEYK